MPRIWCGECGTFVVGELIPGVNLLEQGHVLSPPCAACEGCEKRLAQIDAEERGRKEEKNDVGRVGGA